MRICLYTNTIYKIGGVARVTTFMANHWSKEHDITIISTNPDYEPKDLVYTLSDQIHTLHDPELFIHDESFSLEKHSNRKLKQFIDAHDFDIIIGVEGKYAVALSSALTEFKGVKCAWMHNSFDAYFKTEGEYLWHLDTPFKQAMAMYDFVVVLTNKDKEKFDAHFNLNTTCIVNPITFDIIEPHYNPDSKQLLTVCRVVFKHKGLDLFLETLPNVFNKHPDWTWHLVGDGPDLEALKTQVSLMNLETNIVIHGATDNVRPYYEAASIFVLPSRWEGMPMVSLEAMSFALPLVGFDIDALKEVLGEDLEQQLLVKKYDKHALAHRINTLIEDKEYRSELAILASKRVEHFTLETVATNWDTLFSRNNSSS